MSDEGEPPRAVQVKSEPGEKPTEANIQQQSMLERYTPRDPSVSAVYNSKIEGCDDGMEIVGFKLKGKYKTMIQEFASAQGMSVAELSRRALFFALRHPTILDAVIDDEAAYQEILGPSRHHEGQS